MRLSRAEARKLGIKLPPVRKAMKSLGKTPELFAVLCVAHGLPRPVGEYVFHPSRKWRFDWAWPDQRVALEIDGGIWTGGRHTRGKGFLGDMEKLNEAAILGWRVFRCTPADTGGEVVKLLKRVIQ